MFSYYKITLSCLMLSSHMSGACASEFPAFVQPVQRESDLFVFTASREACQHTIERAGFADCPLMRAIRDNDCAGIDRLAKNGNKVTGMHLEVATAKACVHREDSSMLRALLAQKPPVNHKCGKYQITPLMGAAGTNRVDLVEELLGAGANANVIDKEGSTALHYAAYFDAVDAARHLLAKGGALATACNSSNMTPATIAAIKGSVGMLRLLAKYVNLDTSGIDSTPLAYALKNKKEAAAMLLIAKRTELKSVWRKSKTPLHQSARYGLLEVIRALLPLVPCDVQDELKRTPLMYALLKGQASASKLLIDIGARVDLSDHKKNTPLHAAVAQGMAGIIEKLLVKGADPFAKNKEGKSPKDLTQDPGIRALLENWVHFPASCFVPTNDYLFNVSSSGDEALFSVDENSFQNEDEEKTQHPPLNNSSSEEELDLSDCGSPFTDIHRSMKTPIRKVFNRSSSEEEDFYDKHR